jgi:hypothetical protein
VKSPNAVTFHSNPRAKREYHYGAKRRQIQHASGV